MNLDGITLHCVTDELSQILAGGTISRVYQPEARTLYFRIFNDKGTHHLIITLDDTPRLYVAESMPPTPDVPTGLAMFLRKYYENGRIASIKQLHLDRLIDFDIDVLDMSGKLVTRKMHVELMGKYSNVIFTEDDTIIEALIKTKKNSTAVRAIAPREPYEFPPNFMRMDPFAFSLDELVAMFTVGTDEPLGKWMLQRFNGMSTLVLDELACRTDIDKNSLVKDLSADDITTWCQAVIDFGKELDGVSGAYVYTMGKKEVIFPLELSSLAQYPRRHFHLIQEYLREYEATHKPLNGQQEQLQKKVAKLIEKQKRKIKRIDKELKETVKMDTYKLYGDLLMINAYQQADREKSLTVPNLLSEQQENVTISLDPALSIIDNANKYYKKYTKLRNRKDMSDALHQENQDHLDYLESLEYALANASTKNEIAEITDEMEQMDLLPRSKGKGHKTSTRDILTIDGDGVPIWVGRNNRQNDFLTLKKAHPYDLWFHVKNQPGSHVILASHGLKPTDHQIEMAAQLAAFFSKARESSKVEVDSTLVRHVKKPAHAVPGYVIFDHQTTYIAEPKDWSKK